MKVTDHEGRNLHGKVGNMIYYTVNGVTYARRARIPGKKRKWETEGRDEKQAAAANRFRVMQKLYSYYSREVSPEIWRAAARPLGKKAANLFHATNCRCLDREGRMIDPALFRFTEGELPLPPSLRVEPRGGGRFAAAWEQADDLAKAAPGDRLRAGVLYDDEPLSTRLAEEVSGTRADGGGEFRLDTGRTGAHVYLFFEREDGTAFSPSACFHVTIAGEGRG